MKNLHPNDIPVLAKIFNPNTEKVWILVDKSAYSFYQDISDKLGCTIRIFTHLFDLQKALAETNPSNLTFINLSTKKIDWRLFTSKESLVSIDFNFNGKSTPWQFDFINNPDGTIRWMYDTQIEKPIFLNLYNGSGKKGEIIQKGFKLGFQLGLKKWLKSGSFQVIAPQLFLDTINQELHKSSYAIFTGTVGANRKAVISFEEDGKATQFLKLPLTKKVQELTNREAHYLKLLQNCSFEKLVVPFAKSLGHSLMVSNIRPNNPLSNNDLTPTHLSALAELYNLTTESSLLKKTSVWQAIQADLCQIAGTKVVNNLSTEKVQNIHTQLLKLAEQFDATEWMPLSIAHGDLTPWNTYLSADHLHVYDWELAERLPLLYDAFHYIFQASILIKKMPYSAIKTQMNKLEKTPIVQTILTSFKFDFQVLYQFYLLRTVSYYINRYQQQPHLHEQAHWLVEVWEAALLDIEVQPALVEQ